MKKFNVFGTVSFDIDMDLEAVNQIEANKKAKEMIDDMYHLGSYGAYHTPDDVEYRKLNVDEIEED